MEDIERIEVVRGPNQASYGANAFQGVINIITRSPSTDTGIGVVTSVGKRGFGDYYARMAQNAGPVDWRLSLSSREISSFEDRGAKPAIWDETIRRKMLNAQFAYHPDTKQEWRLQIGLSRGDDNAGTTTEANKYPLHDRSADHNFLQLAWRNAYSPDSEVSLQYYHYDRKDREVYQKSNSVTTPTEWIPVDFNLDTRRDDLEFQQIHGFSDNVKGVWGIGLRRDEAKSPHYLYGLGTVSGNQWQVFGNMDWQISPAWLLHVGAMVENHYLADTQFSPRVALNYAIDPNHSIRISAGQGYRAPTLLEARSREVYPGGPASIADVGNWSVINLDSEQGTFGELGYVGRFPSVKLSVDARLFLDRYNKYIDSVSCNLEAMPNECPFAQPLGYVRPSWFGNRKAYYFYNSGDLEVYGGDLTLDWRHDVLGRFVFSTALTQINAGSMTDLDAEKSAPTHASSLLWTKTFAGGWNTSLGFYYMGYMKWPNDGDDQWAYHKLDLKIGKRFGKPGTDNEIAVTLQNVNDKHSEFDVYYEVERQAFVTLRLSL